MDKVLVNDLFIVVECVFFGERRDVAFKSCPSCQRGFLLKFGNKVARSQLI